MKPLIHRPGERRRRDEPVSGKPRAEITGTRRQASASEVRQWAAGQGFQIDLDGTIPAPVITAYNQTHPDRPY